MIVDSSALVAIILREDEAATFVTAIIDAVDPVISAASYLESAMVLDGRQKAHDPLLDTMIARLGLRVVPFTDEQAHAARSAFLLYGKGHGPAALNFGDCMTYALAKTTGEPLLFKGNEFNQTDLRLYEAAVEGL